MYKLFEVGMLRDLKNILLLDEWIMLCLSCMACLISQTQISHVQLEHLTTVSNQDVSYYEEQDTNILILCMHTINVMLKSRANKAELNNNKSDADRENIEDERRRLDLVVTLRTFKRSPSRGNYANSRERTPNPRAKRNNSNP